METIVNKSGEAKRNREMSNHKMNIACAIDDSNNIILQVADRGRVAAKASILIHDKTTIEHGAIIISDS